MSGLRSNGQIVWGGIGSNPQTGRSHYVSSFVFIDILALFRQFWSATAKLPPWNRVVTELARGARERRQLRTLRCRTPRDATLCFHRHSRFVPPISSRGVKKPRPVSRTST
jgi:hypothetical protein